MDMAKLKDSLKTCFVLLFLLLLLLGPVPPLYTCGIVQTVYVLLIRDKESMISLD